MMAFEVVVRGERHWHHILKKTGLKRNYFFILTSDSKSFSHQTEIVKQKRKEEVEAVARTFELGKTPNLKANKYIDEDP